MRKPLALLLTLALIACGDDGPVGITDPSEGPILEGTVHQVSFEVLLVGVTVSAGGFSTQTTTKGAYKIEGLPLGDVVVTATFEGHDPYTQRVRIREGRNRHDIYMSPS